MLLKYKFLNKKSRNLLKNNPIKRFLHFYSNKIFEQCKNNIITRLAFTRIITAAVAQSRRDCPPP